MTDRQVQRILRQLGGPAKPRPGFKEQLGELLTEELSGDEEDAEGILRLIRGRVTPREGFKKALRVRLNKELVAAAASSSVPAAIGERRGIASRLKGAWWMQSAAAVVALAIVASGFAWTNCLQTIGPPATEVAGPAAPGQTGEAPAVETEPGREAPSGTSETEPAPNQGSRGGSGPAGTQPNQGGASGVPAPSQDQGDPAPQPAEPPDDEPPAVSPPQAGQSPAVLAFASRTSDGYWHIFTMNEDGSDRVQLTHGPFHDREPEWSPDGKHIAFMRLEDEADHYENSRVFVMNADGSGERFLVEGAEPVWSPDGGQLAFAGQGQNLESLTGEIFPAEATVWVINADGTGAHPLPLPGSTAEPSWSSRDDLITFAGIFSDQNSQFADVTNLFRARPDGSDVRRLTSNPYACNASISPDGRRVAYVAFLDVTFDLWTMNTDGTDRLQLTSGPSYDFYPHWSPNGKRIAFGRDPDGEPHWSPGTGHLIAGPEPSAIWEINVDGSGLRRISPPGVDDADPAFRPPRRK